MSFCTKKVQFYVYTLNCLPNELFNANNTPVKPDVTHAAVKLKGKDPDSKSHTFNENDFC